MRSQHILNKTIEYGFYALFFAAPLIFNPSRTMPSFELFEWNKMWFVYLLTAIIMAAWIGKMILQKRINFKRTPFDLPLLLFLLSQILSTWFSIDRHVSIFGYYSRFNGGLLSTICYILLYYAYVSNSRLVQLDKLVKLILASGTIVAAFGIAEHFGIDAHMWVQDVQTRVFSTFGQPNWLAAYLAILLPLTIIQIVSFLKMKPNPGEKMLNDKCQMLNNNSKFRIENLLVIGNWLLVFLFYLCLLFTRSRSGFLGFWFANYLFWNLIWIYQIRKHFSLFITILFITLFMTNNIIMLFLVWKNYYLLYWLISVLGYFAFLILLNWRILKNFIVINLIVILLTFIIGTPFTEINKFFSLEIFQKSLPVEQTQAPIGDSVINIGITDSANIRKIVWKGAWEIAKAYPIFGTGPETFAYSYYKFRPAEHNLTSEWDFLYNKAHNEYLNYAATSGFLGLGTYLLLILWFLFWCVIKLFSTSTKNDSDNFLFLALIAGYISILITNYFGFSVVVVNLFFFLIPAFAICINQQQSQEELIATYQSFSKPQIISFVLLTSCLIVFTFLLSKFWLADSFYAKAYSYDKAGMYEEAYQNIFYATKIRADEPVYHDEQAALATDLTALAIENNQATLAAQMSEDAVIESAKALATSSQNLNFWKTRTKVFYILSQIDPTYIDNALDAILIAQKLAPTDVKIAYNVAVIYGKAGKNREAIDVLQKTIDLKPDYNDAYVALSIFYQEEKDITRAREILELALKRIDPNDKEILERLENLK